jgi:hypothetical protein
MTTRRSSIPIFIFASVALVLTVLNARVAEACVDSEASCTSASSVGASCDSASGTCQRVTCSDASSDDDAGSGSACYACVASSNDGATPQKTARLSHSHFAPTVTGCCSIAGAHPWTEGAGFFAAATAVIVAFRTRRRRSVR